MNKVLPLIVASVATLLSGSVRADRISDMTPAELCAYTAKLEVLAAWHVAKGTARADLKIKWHGDETANEMAFVNRILDEGYALMAREVAAGHPDTPLELLGDRVFEACVSERKL